LTLDASGNPLPENEATPSVETGPALPNVVFQTVTLAAGQTYMLSWWDVARGATGGSPAAGDDAKYRALLLDANWSTVDGESFTAASGPGWSERRSISFTAIADGEYQIAFAPEDLASLKLSIGIGDVQLELLRGDASTATPYDPTRDKRFIVSGDCPTDSAEALRARFDYRCEKGRCFYELRDPLVIDTEVLSQRFSSLVGKVAVGNFNYRTISLGLNLVGTALTDCSRTRKASCYGQGYVEYDLDHQAFSVPLTDLSFKVRCFNFGIGHVFGGKALATERVLTTPLSSADQSLLEQPSITKTELAGRPLSGAYHLRLYDNPALVWSSLEDVQIALKYRYWSGVDRGAHQ
jgi:hypothetical protein